MKHIKLDFILNAWVRPPGWTSGVGQRPKFTFFTEYGHVAYQIKENDAFINIVANFCQWTPGPWGGVKIQPFQNMVMLHVRCCVVDTPLAL